jgi:predicted GNAT superfamily acetyltransferase
MDREGVAAARTVADEAAERAQVSIRDLHEVSEHRTASRLFDEVWGREVPVLPTEIIRALDHAGNQVSGAFDGDRLVGATVAFTGISEDGHLHLHSHITGTTGAGRGVGFALKLYQRAWALERGIDRVTWTFDPLIRRNAYFNLVKLGAHLVGYHRDFYGRLDDELNRGEPTDRGAVTWQLDDPRAVRAAAGHASEPRIDALRTAGATVVLEVGDGQQPVRAEPGSDPLLVQVPEDIETMRHQEAELATRWRSELREVLGDALGSGYRVAGFCRDGWYVLTRRGLEELRP